MNRDMQKKDVDAIDRQGRTALFYASAKGDLAVVSKLIEANANVNVKDKDLNSPLHFAASSYQTAIADFLLKHGALPNAENAHGNTPLSNAVFDSKGRGEMIRLLLSWGASKTTKNHHGVSPEDLAKSIGNYDVAQFFEE